MKRLIIVLIIALLPCLACGGEGDCDSDMVVAGAPCPPTATAEQGEAEEKGAE